MAESQVGYTYTSQNLTPLRGAKDARYSRLVLSKVSLPDRWSKEMSDISEVVDQLRERLCGSCLAEVDPDLPGGGGYQCRDAELLLETGCGLEYRLDGDHGLWPAADELDPEMGRQSRRKMTPKQTMHEWIPTCIGVEWQW